LSLIRKSLTTAGWKDIAVHCDDIGATEGQPSAKRSPQVKLDRRNPEVQYCRSAHRALIAARYDHPTFLPG
jgi:hypothetical protein